MHRRSPDPPRENLDVCRGFPGETLYIRLRTSVVTYGSQARGVSNPKTGHSALRERIGLRVTALSWSRGAQRGSVRRARFNPALFCDST